MKLLKKELLRHCTFMVCFCVARFERNFIEKQSLFPKLYNQPMQIYIAKTVFKINPANANLYCQNRV